MSIISEDFETLQQCAMDVTNAGHNFGMEAEKIAEKKYIDTRKSIMSKYDCYNFVMDAYEDSEIIGNECPDFDCTEAYSMYADAILDCMDACGVKAFTLSNSNSVLLWSICKILGKGWKLENAVKIRKYEIGDSYSTVDALKFVRE